MAAPHEDDFMTPSDLVSQMAFQSSPAKNNTDVKRQSSYEPLAPPPASAPPLPPPPEALQEPLPAFFSQDSQHSFGSSYQNDSSGGGNRAEMPRVTHYNDTHITESTGSSSGRQGNNTTYSYRGDASLRPNTGEMNSADGQALHETLYKLQVVNLVNSAAAILLELPAFLGHVFTLHTSRAILGIYLILFSLILAIYELHTPMTSSLLQDNLGILFHPLGKSLYLILLGGLCIGQAWWPFYIVGGVFWLSALDTLYCFVKFPHYRRLLEQAADEQLDLWNAARNRVVASSSSRYSWARPETMNLLTSSTIVINGDENNENGGGGGGNGETT